MNELKFYRNDRMWKGLTKVLETWLLSLNFYVRHICVLNSL